MGSRMKTTLNIDDTVMAELKREAARQGRTLSELVETALRLLLASRRKRGRMPALPKFRSGGALIDSVSSHLKNAGARQSPPV
jgi:Ribbon-helix-helix protein, copG family